jgi:hypothetical protein
MKYDFPDPNFKSADPSAVLTAEKGPIKIVSKLYGPVDALRLAKEQAVVEYRADQLNPVPKRPERIYRPREDNIDRAANLGVFDY